MKCHVCKTGDATVHLTQIVNGKVQKVDLCEACAKEKGVTNPTELSISDLLFGLEQEDAGTPPRASAESRCPSCEMKLSDFRRAARLGCPRCYEAFSDALAPMLKGMHKGRQHLGKIPPGGGDETAKGDSLMRLRQELLAAVKAENFEAAARLRDQIKILEQRADAEEPRP
ncbi:MAG: UvrB/UvrC motif-containing protein [Verrucomicrobiae bacterium]|nr:UvrB/UvrC motif-containing protein [Verrucomicrobiae bacterium]